MTTYNTGNPVPSGDARDRFDNTQTLDEFVNSPAVSTTTRTGAVRTTLAGINYDFNQFLLNSGYESTHLAYVAGQPLQVNRPTQLIDYNGSVYRIKMPATFPVMLTGNWATDSAKLLDVGDQSLRTELAAPGSQVSIAGQSAESLSLPARGVIYAESAVFGNNLENAIAALQDNYDLIIRKEFAVSRPAIISGRTGVRVIFSGAGKITGASNFSFPTANARGALHFVDCFNAQVFDPVVFGARVARNPTPSDNLDGDAGIEFLRCVGTRVWRPKIRHVMSWGIIHIQCGDTGVWKPDIRGCTLQSGIGHATVIGGWVEGGEVSYCGLYGVEIEGLNNSGITSTGVKVHHCLVGNAMIGAATDCHFIGGSVSHCTWDVQCVANGNTQVSNSVRDVETYDTQFHFYIADTNFLSIIGPRSFGRVAGAFVPNREADYIAKKINSTTILSPLASQANITVGDEHQFVDGPKVTVESFSTVTDANYGDCVRIVYASSIEPMSVGDFFMRNVSFIGSQSSWLYMTGDTNNNLEVFDASCMAPLASGLVYGSKMANHRLGEVKFSQVKTIVNTLSESTPITNSQIAIKRGNFAQPTAILGGIAKAKLGGALIGEIRTFTMAAPAKPFTFSTTGVSAIFRVVVNLTNTVKTANTGAVSIKIGTNEIATIPASELGAPLNKRDVLVNVPDAANYTITIADTYGDLQWSSATVEIHTIEY